MAEPPNAAPGQEIFSLSIHETLDRAQTSHGVMHEDYHQYQEYCTNRLSRLRHAKPVRRELVHNSKYAEGVQMRRNAYCPRMHAWDPKPNNNETEPPTDETPAAAIPHENVLWIPLFLAERAWAQACEFQKQKKRHQLVLRKLRKAVHCATTLQRLAEKACDTQTQTEVTSYVGWMTGHYALQKREFAAAYTGYHTAMTTLLSLAGSQQEQPTSSNKEEAAQRLVLADLWNTRAESVVRPLLQYCQYECKDDLPPVLLQQQTAATSKQQPPSVVIHFRGKDIPLDSYKELCVLHLKATSLREQQQQSKTQTTISKQQQQKDTTFLSLLSTYDDAIAFVEAELANFQSIASPGPAVAAKINELESLVGYWKYQKLYLGMHQNEERIAECHSDAEIVHVYDALWQTAQAMAQLPGVDEEAQAQVLRIRAFRCYYLARVYHGTLHQPAEAMLLLRQAQMLVKRATEELAACDTRDKEHEQEMEAHLDALEQLESTELVALEVRLEASEYLRKQGGGASGGGGTERPLWMRLDEADPGTLESLVDCPPRYIPIPCKPTFYDLAYKPCAATFPMKELQEHMDRRNPETKQEPSSSGGIFGWLKG